MTLPNVKYDVRNVRDNARIVRAARVGRELAEGYPRAALGVGQVLAVACAVLFRSDYTTVAAALAVAVVVGTLTWQHMPRRKPEPEPQDDPYRAERWFLGVCRHACVPEPLVLRDWPTESGHAFELLVTANVAPGEHGVKRPMTVGEFISHAARLRDCAGLGCRNIHMEPDPDNGGRCTAYVNGIRFEDWMPEPEYVEPDPTTEIPTLAAPVRACSIKGCDELPTTHVLHPNLNGLWVCGAHVAPTIDHLGGDLDHHPFNERCEYGQCIELPEPDDEDRKRTPDFEPLSPLGIHGEGVRSGSGAWLPPDPTTRRPPGAEPGTRGAALWDALRTAVGPLRRGTLAEASGLSPTTVDKMLTAWADLGMTSRVGSLWIASTEYAASGNLPAHGEEDHRG